MIGLEIILAVTRGIVRIAGTNMTDNPDRTFKPVIREGHILAGGMRLCQVDDEGRVIFEDRFTPRSGHRGGMVPVDLVELLDLILGHYREDLTRY